MANLITVVTVLLFDVACGCTFGWSLIWIVATAICAIDLVFNVYVYATTKTKPKITNSKLEEMRNIITTHCLTELGWDAVGSGIIGDSAVEVWCVTHDGKKGKSCIYKVDADGVNCYVNVNNINWGDINEQ